MNSANVSAADSIGDIIVCSRAREAVEQRLAGIAEHRYAPLDFPWAVARAIEKNPTVAVATTSILRSEAILQQARAAARARDAELNEGGARGGAITMRGTA